MRVLVESREDVASRTIAKALRRRHAFEPDATARSFRGRAVESSEDVPDAVLVSIETRHIHAERLDEDLAKAGVAPDAVVFLSRHASKTGRPTLTVHPLGNFGEAPLGGEADRFTPAPARLMTHTLRKLKAARDAANYDAEVAYEVTHHGPLFTRTPAFFVELGSTEKAWKDATGGRLVAGALVEALTTPVPDDPVLLGLGGGHYAPRFTEAALTRPVAYGHMWPRHRMGDDHDPAVLVPRLVEASADGVVGAHVHQLPVEARDAVRAALDQAGLPERDPGQAA